MIWKVLKPSEISKRRPPSLHRNRCKKTVFHLFSQNFRSEFKYNQTNFKICGFKRYYSIHSRWAMKSTEIRYRRKTTSNGNNKTGTAKYPSIALEFFWIYFRHRTNPKKINIETVYLFMLGIGMIIVPLKSSPLFFGL